MIVKLVFKILNIFFMLLGIIFLILITYLWIVDPFKIKPEGLTIRTLYSAITGNKVAIDNVDKNPLLTEEQEALLESIGVNPSTLPQEITPALQACFVTNLGDERIAQIINGSSPTTTDYFKASSCIN